MDFGALLNGIDESSILLMKASVIFAKDPDLKEPKM